MSDAHGGPKGVLPFLTEIEHLMHNAQGSASIHVTGKQLITAFVVVLVTFFIFEPQQSINNFSLVVFLSPLWVSIILGYYTSVRFVQAKRAEFFHGQEYVLLEVMMPRETTKTPFAMETFFANMHIGSGETTPYKKYIQGGTRPWWSFEIVSIGGRVHFYIWTRVGYRRLVEAYLYAQYPEVQIIEAEDYSRLIDPTDHDHSMFAGEFLYSKADPYPLKTYVDYKMEPGDKPEETVDPLGSLIETMGSIGPGEQFWIQFIIRLNKGEKFRGKKKEDGTPFTYNDEVTVEIESIKKKAVRKGVYNDPLTGKTVETEGFPNPTKGQGDLINAIERKANKQLFDVGVRSIYLGTNEAYQGIMIPAMIAMFKPFNNQTGNALGILGIWSAMFLDYPWEDRSGHHKHHIQHEALRMYRQRAFFYEPYRGTWNVMSTEELATLYHVPSSAVTSPALGRTQSTTASAPTNLPS